MTRRAPAVLAAAVPFAAALAFTLACGVDLPRQDEWNMVSGIERAFDGTVTARGFFQPHNEHVAVFPRLVMVPLALATRWDLRVQMVASVAFMAAAFVLIARLLARVPGLSAWSWPLAAAFVFSLHAVDTWIWACQIHVAMAVFGIAGALALLGADRLRLRTMLAAGFFGLIASWSFLSGFLVWPAGAAALLLRPFEGGRARLRALAVWIACAAVAIALPVVTAAERPPTSFTSSVSDVFEFSARYLGAGLLGSQTDPAILSVVGWIAQVGFVAGAAWTAIRRRRSPQVLAVLAIGAVGFATGPMVALGRLVLSGLATATATRYSSFASLAWIAILLLPWLAIERAGRGVRTARLVLAAAAVVALLATQIEDVRTGREMAQARTEAAAAFRRGEGVTFANVEAAATPDLLLPHLAEHLAVLRRHRLSLFRHATAAELGPEPWKGPLEAAFVLRTENGRRRGVVVAGGGVPGNVAFAVLASGDRVRLEGPAAFDRERRTEISFPLEAYPDDPNETYHVMSIDREGRIIQSPRYSFR